ncbi:MAG: hypothetical protein H6Q72_1427 [Firmicutes bacterium]|nr:hypothetical protein [Bacillota bacterium]
MANIELDFTECKDFEQSITRSGSNITVIIRNEHSRLELAIDMAEFADLIADGALILNKNMEAA